MTFITNNHSDRVKSYLDKKKYVCCLILFILHILFGWEIIFLQSYILFHNTSYKICPSPDTRKFLNNNIARAYIYISINILHESFESLDFRTESRSVARVAFVAFSWCEMNLRPPCRRVRYQWQRESKRVGRGKHHKRRQGDKRRNDARGGDETSEFCFDGVTRVYVEALHLISVS